MFPSPFQKGKKETRKQTSYYRIALFAKVEDIYPLTIR